MMSRPFRRMLAASLAPGLAGAAFAGPAGAAGPPALEFTWEAPEDCPDRARVVAEIERLTGRPVERDAAGDAGASRLSVKAIVTRSARGLSVSITSEAAGATHDRRVEAPTCKEAADATALIVAMALDPGLAPPGSAAPGSAAPGSAAPGSAAPGAPEGPSASAGKEAPAERSAAGDSAPPGAADSPPAGAGRGAAEGASAPVGPSRGPELRGEARAMFALDAAALPSAAPGAAIALGLWIGSFRIDATGSAFPEQRKTLGTGGGGDVGLATGGLTAWIAPVRRPLDVLLGAGIEAGAIWGHGFGVDGARSATAPWVAVRAGAGMAYSFTSRLGASLAALVLVPLVRERFLLGSEELFVSPPAALRLEAGLFFRFP
jgi:hypothetical protein